MNNIKYKTLIYPLNDNVYILNNMLVRLDQVFLETTQKLKKPFTPADKEKLAEDIELNYNKIISIISAQELAKENSKPTIIELGNIGSRFFALNIYYNIDENRYLFTLLCTKDYSAITP